MTILEKPVDCRTKEAADFWGSRKQLISTGRDAILRKMQSCYEPGHEQVAMYNPILLVLWDLTPDLMQHGMCSTARSALVKPYLAAQTKAAYSIFPAMEVTGGCSTAPRRRLHGWPVPALSMRWKGSHDTLLWAYCRGQSASSWLWGDYILTADTTTPSNDYEMAQHWGPVSWSWCDYSLTADTTTPSNDYEMAQHRGPVNVHICGPGY